MDIQGDDFDQAASGAAESYPKCVGRIKKNEYCMLKGRPCRVVELSTSKTGKHGHAKANITGLDIFTGRKYEDMCPTSHNIDVPVVTRLEYQIIDISEDKFCTLMTEGGETKSDLKLPTEADGNLSDISKKLMELYEAGSSVLVTVLSACQQEKIVSYKVLEQ